jgi:hypothetical protein
MASLRVRLRRIAASYGGDQPLNGYLAALAGYATALGGLAGVALGTRRRLPEQLAAGDIALITVATHKLARIMAKDSVTSPLRAPVTRFTGAAGGSEVHEEVRAAGARHAAAELIGCPFCLAVWIATGFCAGLVFAPRPTRLVATGLTTVAGADFLHLAYDAAKQASGNTGGG